MERQPRGSLAPTDSPLGSAGALAVALFVLVLASRTESYLLFHTVAELFSILVAMVLAVVAWYSFPFSRNSFLMYLGCGYFWVGLLDLCHTLVYKGMAVLPVMLSDPSSQLWLAARFVQALVLLTAPWFLTREVRRGWALGIYGLLAIALIVLVATGKFPTAFVDGHGPTPFKVSSEYVIIAMLAAAAAWLWASRDLIDREILSVMMLSIVFTMIAELAFAYYALLSGVSNVAGHILKLASYWLVFIAVVRTTLVDPFRVMARGAHTYDAIPDSTIVVDLDGVVRATNDAARSEADLGEAALVGQHCHGLFHPPEIAIGECPVCQRIARGEATESVEVEFPESGRWIDVKLSPVRSRPGVTGMVHVSRDVTARKRYEVHLEHLAHFDELTGLPNRILISDRISQALVRAKRRARRVAVMMVDLDQFKEVNDTLGHLAGDEVLATAADRLASCVRGDDTVGRLGGDEFVVTLGDLATVADSRRVAMKIVELMSLPIQVGDREVVTTASVGIAVFPDDGSDPITLTHNADMALLQAKGDGRATYRFFSVAMDERARETEDSVDPSEVPESAARPAPA